MNLLKDCHQLEWGQRLWPVQCGDLRGCWDNFSCSWAEGWGTNIGIVHNHQRHLKGSKDFKRFQRSLTVFKESRKLNFLNTGILHHPNHFLLVDFQSMEGEPVQWGMVFPPHGDTICFVSHTLLYQHIEMGFSVFWTVHKYCLVKMYFHHIVFFMGIHVLQCNSVRLVHCSNCVI